LEFKSVLSTTLSLTTKVCLRSRPAEAAQEAAGKSHRVGSWQEERVAQTQERVAFWPERKAGEKSSPSKTAAGQDKAAKKVAKAKKCVSFVSSDDDDLPKSGELETLKGAKSSEEGYRDSTQEVPEPTMT